MHRSSLHRLGLALLETLFTSFSSGSVAIARNNDAGTTYSRSAGVSYCSTFLTTRGVDAEINVREGQGTIYEIRHYVLVKDWAGLLHRDGTLNVWMSGQDIAVNK